MTPLLTQTVMSHAYTTVLCMSVRLAQSSNGLLLLCTRPLLGNNRVLLAYNALLQENNSVLRVRAREGLARFTIHRLRTTLCKLSNGSFHAWHSVDVECFFVELARRRG